MSDKEDNTNQESTGVADTVSQDNQNPRPNPSFGSKTGRVKWFNHSRGYGFIQLIDHGVESRDYFVHHTNLVTQNSVYKTLQKGEFVNFNEKIQDNKYYAVDVTGINGYSLLCEIPKSRNKK